MACSETLNTLKRIETLLAQNQKKLIMHSSIYDGLCSSIGNVRKELLADDSLITPSTKFSRLTVKCRTLGTNTYIGIGIMSTNFRFTAAGQAMTWKAPVINGSVVPFILKGAHVLGSTSSGAGVLEISGIMVYEKEE